MGLSLGDKKKNKLFFCISLTYSYLCRKLAFPVYVWVEGFQIRKLTLF